MPCFIRSLEGSLLEQKKRLVIQLPESIVYELDHLVQEEQVSRNQLIREAIHTYLMERKRQDVRERMQLGYMEMGAINLDMAAEAFLAEEEANYTLRHKASGV
jgi:CopG family transcriptional regulator/antitoxin EndoAI